MHKRTQKKEKIQKTKKNTKSRKTQKKKKKISEVRSNQVKETFYDSPFYILPFLITKRNSYFVWRVSVGHHFFNDA